MVMLALDLFRTDDIPGLCVSTMSTIGGVGSDKGFDIEPVETRDQQGSRLSHGQHCHTINPAA